MGNTVVFIDGNFHQVLRSGFFAFADCLGNFSGLAHACAYMAVAVTDNNQGSKPHGAAAFYRLGYALDSNDLICQFQGTGIEIIAFHRFAASF